MKLPIVNKNDEVIGYKDKGELNPLDIYRVSRLAILNSKGQLLMAQRAFTKKKDPGAWGLAVEGTVEEGETYETNVRKEAEEEIGVTLGDIELGPKFHRSGKYNHFCQAFIYHADLNTKEMRLQVEEVAQVAWYDIPVLQQEAASMPDKFGYNFKGILDVILPYLSI